jgi:hypothetical protein
VTQPIIFAIVYAALTALFAFQLWSVVRTGHVRWRVQKVHREHRPMAFAVEIVACAIGLILFGTLLILTLLH